MTSRSTTTTLLAAAAGALLLMPMMATDASAHGCHREPQLGVYGWHRHVGPDCVRVAVPAPRYYRDYRRDDNDDRRYSSRRFEGREHHHRDRCEIKCRYIGPIKTCKRRCD